jgi:CheY-like chemotaxis protein
VQADGDQIGQVVLNLLVNAQQALASVAGRRLRWPPVRRARRDGRAPRRVWLRVADTGPGVPKPPAREHLRALLHHQARGPGHRPGAVGVAHAGARARRRAGARRPAARAPASADAADGRGAGRATEPTAVPEAAGDSAGRVLVVDDESEIAELMRAFSNRAGYEVATAESARWRWNCWTPHASTPSSPTCACPTWTAPRCGARCANATRRWPARMLFVTGDTLSPAGVEQFLDAVRLPATLDKPFARADLLANA